ncbi:MAG TPA: type II secretion system F family protein, partial [Thermodesulfovibrionia bacterium]|nr:type II secretion system F family protein [Thermodesulfovibrionia bacterium]
MESYTYEATTKEGNIMKGTIQAVSERFAIDQIQDMGYFPLNVNRAEKEKAFDMDALPFLRSRVTEKDVMTFTYQLGVLLDAGFTLDKALSVLLDLSEKKVLKSLIKEILSHIKSGKSLSESLSKFPSAFPLFYVNMVKAGETGGFLEETISRMAVYLENSQALKEDIRSALIYPLVLSIVGGAAVVVLLTFVVPKFTMIFSDMGGALPLPTIILLAVSNGLRHYWWVVLLFVLGVFFYLSYYLKNESGRRWWDGLKFKLPLFGKLYKEAAVANFARTFGTLLKSGVPILNALQIVKGTLRSERLAEIISSVRDGVKKGRGISEPLKNSDIFPPIAVHMVIVGEETGRLDEMLFKIAERFDLEVRTTVKRLLSLLEPVLILSMGIVVGFIVIAMLMAIF